MPTPDSSHGFQSTSAMPAPADENRGERLAAARADLVALVDDVKKIVEARAAQVKHAAVEGAEAGMDGARDTIRSYPIPAVAAAFLVGAAVAVAFVPSARRSPVARLREWAPDISRADLEQIAGGLQKSATSTGSSLLSAFERVVDSVSSMDAKSSLTPTIEKAASWLNSLRGAMSGK